MIAKNEVGLWPYAQDGAVLWLASHIPSPIFFVIVTENCGQFQLWTQFRLRSGWMSINQSPLWTSVQSYYWQVISLMKFPCFVKCPQLEYQCPSNSVTGFIRYDKFNSGPNVLFPVLIPTIRYLGSNEKNCRRKICTSSTFFLPANPVILLTTWKQARLLR